MDKKSNSISPKTRDANGITIVKVAAFAFAIVSWNATADGLSTYIFTESQWMATLISFGINPSYLYLTSDCHFIIIKLEKTALIEKQGNTIGVIKKGKKRRHIKVRAFKELSFSFT